MKFNRLYRLRSHSILGPMLIGALVGCPPAFALSIRSCGAWFFSLTGREVPKAIPATPYPSRDSADKRLATPYRNVTDVAYAAMAVHDRLRVQLTGSLFSDGPFAMKGRSRDGQDFRGMVISLSLLEVFMAEGMTARGIDQEVWFTSSPGEALSYAFMRGTSFEHHVDKNQEDQVFVVFQCDLSNEKLSPHPHGDSTYYAKGRVDAKLISHAYVFDPRSLKSERVLPFQVVTNPKFQGSKPLPTILNPAQ